MENIKTIEVKIEGKEWQDALDKAFKEANKKAKIDGFRPGHAPKEVFIKKYGEESLFMDAADKALQSAYVKVLEENKDLEIVTQPSVELKNVSKDALELTFKLILKPEFKLGDYKNLKVKKDKVEVTNEEVNSAIDEMKNRYAEVQVKDGKVEKGDTAVIDFEGFKDGVAFEGGKGENYSLKIGSNTFIPGFEDQIIGMSKGEEKDVKVTFPEDYHSEELKGAKATFKVKVNEVKETIIPSLNEEFFKDLNMEGVNDRASLESALKETLAARKEQQAEGEYVDKLLEKLSEQTKIELPEEMIGDEIHRMIHQYEDNLKMQGITLEQFYQFTNSNEDMLKEQMKDEAVKRIKYRLMLEEIIKLEKLTATDEEADKEASEIASKYGMEKEDFLTQFGGLEMIKYDLEMRKAIDVLKGNK
ncbi:MAG: trigger factor [Bacillales bacterium]|nr:trigger factor [Bacillales bacterium]